MNLALSVLLLFTVIREQLEALRLNIEQLCDKTLAVGFCLPSSLCHLGSIHGLHLKPFIFHRALVVILREWNLVARSLEY